MRIPRICGIIRGPSSASCPSRAQPIAEPLEVGRICRCGGRRSRPRQQEVTEAQPVLILTDQLTQARTLAVALH
jgi:hypothetical protein